MDREEAASVLATHLDRLEAEGYDHLVARIGDVETFEVITDRGAKYQLEFQTVWDFGPGGTVRILGSIDDGGLRAVLPLSDDRLVDRAG